MSKKNNTQEIVQEYFLDYELFDTTEIIKITAFYKLIVNINKGKSFKKEDIINKYNEYRSIINNKSLEKKYDSEFEKLYNCSIYKTMQNILK